MTTYQKKVNATRQKIEKEGFDMFSLNRMLGHAVRIIEVETRKGFACIMDKEYRDALIQVIRNSK